MTLQSFENFKPSEVPNVAADSSTPFQNELFETTIGEQTRKAATTAAFERPAGAPPAPEGVDSAAWAQISQMIAGGTEVNFTTADEGKVPDFFLGSDGKLVANPEASPSPDGSKTIQVERKDGAAASEIASKQAAQQLEVAKVQEQIFYWQKANPGSDSIPQFLQTRLAHAQSQAAIRPNPGDSAPDAHPGPQQQARQDAPRQQSVSNGGGGAPQSIGGRNIGRAPEGGFRRGSFEPLGPIDRNAIPRPVEGDVAIKGPPSCNAEQIQKFLEDIGSPAAKEAGFSKALYDTCTERGIDPAVAVGFFLQESTCGRYGRARENLSMGNIKGTAPESGGTDGTFRRYNSWAEGARDWARLIDDQYVQKRGLTSLSQVISVYAPSSDNNNEAKYVSTVNGVVENFKRMNNGTAVA